MEKTRSYRNVFGQMGIPQEQIERRLEEIKNTFFFEEEERVYYPVGEDMAYIMDTGNNDARTEGMSYGMMLCVQLDMKDEFDRLWKWAKTYMWMEEGENEGYFAWSCSTDGKKNAYGPAPDGEEYFAMALFFASHRWGDGEGIFAYGREARDILKACLHKGKEGERDVLCGIRKIIRFCLCRERTLRIPPIICLIFTNYLRCGRMRKTEISGNVQPLPAVSTWRRHVIP